MVRRGRAVSMGVRCKSVERGSETKGTDGEWAGLWIGEMVWKQRT